MRKHRVNRNLLLRSAAIGLTAVFLIATALLLIQIWDRQQGLFPSRDQNDAVTYNGREYVLRDNVETFLVLGLDKYEDYEVDESYNNNSAADFLMLLVFDNGAKKCTAIHINRDTMADINVLGVAGNRVGNVVKQIALAHTYGSGKGVSCRNTADAVSELLLGVHVDHYLSLTMDSVPVFNDLVGGVELTVLDDFAGVDDSLVKGETVRLMGEQALHYIRTRKGLEDSSNAARMLRQQQYIRALYDQAKTKVDADDEFVLQITKALSDYMVSDRTVEQLQEISRKVSEYQFEEIKAFEGENRVGEKFMEFYPDPDSIRETVIRLFYEPKE